jgi:beta-N-acetylhexosaminidase
MHGLSDGGVIAAVKHFPGHGSTTQDSHLTLPTVPKTDAALRRTELPPFVAAVEQNAAMVMTAHVRYPAWDAAVPATLSPRIIQGLLRDELRYDGVVITDDLAMRAVSDRFPAGEAAVRSVEAGCDLLLLSGPAAAQHATLDALRAAIESGRLSESRIDESVTRILRLKHRYDIMIEDR